MVLRRDFLKGMAMVPLVGSFLVKDPRIVNGSGLVNTDTGLVIPEQPEIIIATEMPAQRVASTFSMYVTKIDIHHQPAPMIDVTDWNNSPRREFIQGEPTFDVEIGGRITGELTVFGPPFGNHSMLGRKMLVTLTTVEDKQ